MGFRKTACKRATGLLMLLFLGVFVLVPRGVCLGQVVSDGRCCQGVTEAVKTCCQSGASHDQADSDAAPLSAKKSCFWSSDEELASPMRQTLDLDTDLCADVALPGQDAWLARQEFRRLPVMVEASPPVEPLRGSCVLRI